MAAQVTALEVGPLEIGPTPLAMLIVLLVLGLIGVVVLLIGSQAGGKLVDKRWPANEPLSPSEVLWAEAGGHVSKNFPGLDPVIAQDLTLYMKSRKVAPGDPIVERGDLATEFVMLKSGAAQQIAADGSVTVVKPGASFGGESIIRREPHSVSVTATEASELMVLDAEDYLAGVALGMTGDDEQYVVRVLGQYLTGS